MTDANSQPVTIRIAAPQDGRALMQLIDQVNAETEFLGRPEERMPWQDPAQVLREMAERGSGVYILAQRGETLLGYLGAYPGGFERNRGAVYIAHVGLLAIARGQRIGGALFDAVEAWSRERGAWRLELRVDEVNGRGRGLYARQGFTVQGRFPHGARLEDGWHAHLWMAKPLRVVTEPSMAPVDPPAPRERIAAGDIGFRDVGAADAAAMVAWERQVLADLPCWLKLPREVSDEATTATWMTAAAERGQLMHAAVAGPRILGYVGAWRQPGQRMRHDAIFTLSVLREAWGAGVGQGLFARLLDWAKTGELHRLSTSMAAQNTRGLRFAERHGFAREVVSPGYTVIDGQAIDRVQLGRVLE
jgi:GNAT superfamily N-acetyltransferase